MTPTTAPMPFHHRGRGRGRGRGARPTHGGRGRGRDEGPRLPGVLASELGLERLHASTSRGGGRSGRGGGRDGGKRRPPSRSHPGGKRARASDRPRINFEALMEEQGVAVPGGKAAPGAAAAALAAEEALQRRLAKKLGIKGAARKRVLGDDRAQATTTGLDSDGEREEEEALFRSSSDGDGSESSLSSDGAPSGSLLSSGSEDEGEDASLLSSGSDESGSQSPSGSDGSDSDDAPPSSTPPPATTAAATGRYMPPAARRAAAATADNDPHAATRRRVTGLLNRLADANLASVGREVATLYREAVGAAVRPALVSTLVDAVARGPRATPAFAGVAAAFVAGVSGAARAPEIAAEFCAAVAGELEAAAGRADGVAAANLAAVTVALHAAGVLTAPALLDMLDARLAAFTDTDVAAASAVLRGGGARLRRDDPVGLKRVVLAAAAAVARARAADTLTPRADALLSLVLDVKNNRVAAARGSAAAAPAAAPSPAAAHWLRDVGAADVATLHGVTWSVLLAPDKRGAWWLPPAGGFEGGGGDAGDRGGSLPSTTLSPLDAASADLLRLAAAHRMTTEPRKVAFCVVMSAADAADAAERLLRLPLRGAAAREIVRVPVECALREAAWNPYYHHLLVRLAAAGRAHRASLRLALHDALASGEAAAAAAATTPGGDAASARRAAHAARLAGGLIAAHTIPLAPLLAGVELVGAPPAPRVAVWRSLVRTALSSARSREDAAAPFERLAAAASRPPPVDRRDGEDGEGGDTNHATPRRVDVGTACGGLRAFIRRRVVPWLAEAPAGTGGPSLDEMTLRAKAAEKALAVGQRAAAARAAGFGEG